MSSRGDNKLKTIFNSRWFLALSAALLLLLAISYARAYYQNYQIDQEIRRLQNETKKLEARKIETTDLLKYVKSPAYVEEKARTELNLVKDGEQVAFIPAASSGVAGQTENKAVESSGIANLIKWWQYFFGTDKLSF